ncbi:hypothetical protein AB0D35_34110, partial [Streptomyces sp. NPDC048301]|uniref:hypothetical protein n=1 Tax=Streptomyces sp. NPDC048301 TaxID=3155631 RepID=UPI00343F3CE2
MSRPRSTASVRSGEGAGGSWAGAGGPDGSGGNAANPEAAYQEALDVAGAHQSSYGREAAGV